MRVLIEIGPITLIDLVLFETTAPAEPERPQQTLIVVTPPEDIDDDNDLRGGM